MLASRNLQSNRIHRDGLTLTNQEGLGVDWLSNSRLVYLGNTPHRGEADFSLCSIDIESGVRSIVPGFSNILSGPGFGNWGPISSISMWGISPDKKSMLVIYRTKENIYDSKNRYYSVLFAIDGSVIHDSPRDYGIDHAWWDTNSLTWVEARMNFDGDCDLTRYYVFGTNHVTGHMKSSPLIPDMQNGSLSGAYFGPGGNATITEWSFNEGWKSVPSAEIIFPKGVFDYGCASSGEQVDIVVWELAIESRLPSRITIEDHSPFYFINWRRRAEIWVSRRDGSEMRKVGKHKGSRPTRLSISPDGRKLTENSEGVIYLHEVPK